MNSEKFSSAKLVEARMARGMTSAQLAKELELDRQAIYRYEKGMAPRPELRVKIADILGVPVSFFYERRSDYLEDETTIFFRRYASTKKIEKQQTRVQNRWVYKIFGLVSNYIGFPKFDLPEEVYKLRKEDYYSIEEIEAMAYALRSGWNLSDAPIPNLCNLLEAKGFIIGNRISYGDDSVSRVDACSEFIVDRPFLFLEHDKSAARLRMSLAHELGHILLHNYVSEDDLEDKVAYKRIEYEAKYFAGAFLLPESSFGDEVWSAKLDHLISLKRRWNVSIGGIVMRAHQLGLFSDNQKERLFIMMGRKRMKKVEPLDEIIPIEKPVLFKQAFDLVLKNGKETPHSIKMKIGLNGETIEMLASLPKGMLEKKNESTRPHLRLVQ